jgi:P27 family predicted phage terminase small subunit
MGMRGPLPRQMPKPAASTAIPLPPPAWLPPPAVEVWHEVEPRLRAACRLRHEHGDTLAAWCCTASELRALSVVIARDGSTATGPHGRHPSPEHAAAMRGRTVLLTLGRALGLDPASAARLEAAGGPGDDPADEVAAYARSRGRCGQNDAVGTTGNAVGRSVLDFVRARGRPAAGE